MLKKMQQSVQKGFNSSQNNTDLVQRNDKLEKQMDGIVNTFKQCSEQNSRLTNLYDHAKFKNQKLLKANLKLRQDLSYLKHYCNLIELELEKLGFQKNCNQEMLSRKETAEGILLTYDQSSISQDENNGLDSGYSQLKFCISKLEQENRKLKYQLTNKQRGISKSVQAGGFEGQSNNIWHKAYEISEQKVRRLEWQMRQLKKLNDNLQMQKMKRGITNFIMEDRKQIFNNIHKIISDYKKKIKQLASQKKDAERKYKNLKEKLNTRLDETSQIKLLEIYTQKIDILQKLTEKQQIQIQNTIQLYQVQIKKIQQRRLEQISVYDNARLDLQTQNLKLHIDLQKSLNKRDDISIQLIQQRNRKQILLTENAAIAQKLQFLMNQKLQKCLKFQSGLIKIDIYPQKKLIQVQKQQKLVPILNKDEQFNAQNPMYSSHIFQKKQLQQYHIKLPKRQSSLTKNSLRNKINITYNQPYMINRGPKFNIISSPVSSANVNKTYGSILQYKKKFIQRKPQSSFNQ